MYKWQHHFIKQQSNNQKKRKEKNIFFIKIMEMKTMILFDAFVIENGRILISNDDVIQTKKKWNIW